MSMASERTVWADGMGLSDSVVEELTLIAEESERVMGESRPTLPADDVRSWALYLEEAGLDELAKRARAAVRDL